MSTRQWLWLVFLSLLWGGSFFAVAIAVKEVPPLTLVLLRVFLAAAFLWAVLAVRGQAMAWTTSAWLAFLGMALFNNVIPFTAIVTGQQTIASGLASVLNATTPIWSIVLLHIFTDDKLTISKVIGVVLGALGVATLIGPDALGGLSPDLVGMALIILATFSYGCSAVWGRRLRSVPPLLSATGQLTCSSLLMLPLALAVEQPWTLAMPSAGSLVAVVSLAIVSTAIAYLVFFHIIAVSGPANVMLVTLLIPVSAIALGTLFLDEVLLARHFAGALVIGAGLVVIDGRLGRWLGGIARQPTRPG